MQRRLFLRAAGVSLGAGLLARQAFGAAPATPAGADPVAGLAPGLTAPEGVAAPVPPAWPMGPLARVRAEPGRIVRMTCCLRPFRAQGPRLEVERIGAKRVVHNYGHGGSGWSLSWGCGHTAARLALAEGGPRDIAVIGAGAIGLTTAVCLQRAGARVTLYARDRPPFVRSSYATGVWSPDSRIALEAHATPAFTKEWERLCRESFREFQHLLSLPGEPVVWNDRYSLSDLPWDEARKRAEAEAAKEGLPKFAHFNDLVKDLGPRPEDLPLGSHPFPALFVRRNTTMVFNLTTYSRQLFDDFRRDGGRYEQREFHTAADFAGVAEATLVNCTGFGAKALLDDASLTPVRGQLCALIPQADVTYGLSVDGASMVPRADGIIVQAGQASDHGSTDETVRRAESETAVRVLAGVMARMKA